MPKHGYYHCIECGALFEAPVQDLRDQRCPVCGNPPTGKILAGPEPTAANAPVVRSGDSHIQPTRELHGVNQDSKLIQAATAEARSSKRRGRVKRTKRKERRSKKIWIMVGLWMMLMVGLVILMKSLNSDDDSAVDTGEADSAHERMLAEAEAKKKRMQIKAAIPLCTQVMTDFLNKTTVASKAQYVYDGAKLVGVMNRYYQRNPSFSVTHSSVRVLRAEILSIPGHQKVIGTVCQNNLGKRFEAIFVHNGKEWKIDWESLVRYDATAWSMFTSGNDGDEGVFRLYMRVRDTDEDLNLKDMSVVFYKPGKFIDPDSSGLASMPVSVARDSLPGKKIQSMLESEEDLVRDDYGYTIDGLDPLGYHRVRVKLKLIKEEGEPIQMELVEILANHWYGLESDREPVSGSDSDGA